MYPRIIYPDSDLLGRARPGDYCCIHQLHLQVHLAGARAPSCGAKHEARPRGQSPRYGHTETAVTGFCNDGFQNQGITMLNYERHLIVVTVICLVIIAVAIVAIVMDVPLPFIGRG